MIEIVKKDLSIAAFGSTWSRTTNREVDISTKKIVKQNGDINEWKRRGIFLIIFNTPVLPVATTKSIIHNWHKLKKQTLCSTKSDDFCTK